MADIQSQLRVPSPTLHATLAVATLVFFSLIAMACFLKVEVVSSGQGRFLSVDRVKTVTSEVSGRISVLHVRDGMHVRKGQLLVALEATEQDAELRGVEIEKEYLTLELLRLKEMAANLTPDGEKRERQTIEAFRKKIAPYLAKSTSSEVQLDLLNMQIETFAEALSQNTAQSKVIQLSQEVTRAELLSVEKAITLQKQRLSVSQSLLERGAISRSNYLDVQLGLIEFEGRRAIAEKQIEKDKAELLENKIGRKQLISNTNKTLVERRIQIEARIKALDEEERISRHRLQLTMLRAPADGIVDQLLPISAGSLVGIGTALMRILPTSRGLELEGRFSTKDAGSIVVGQRANIHIDAFPSERFGVLKATISYKSLDSVRTDDGGWAYVVRATPDHSYLDANGRRIELLPGMTARVDAVTDQRRIISYFFAPVLSAFENSLQER